MKKQAIIFDVDGVLINSFDVYLDCYKDIARKLGKREPTQEEVKVVFGYRLEKILHCLFGEHGIELEELYKKARVGYEHRLRVMEGLENFLQRTKERKAIVTSRRMSSLSRSFADFLGYFEVIVTMEDTKELKPNPEPLLFACKRLGLSVDKAVYIGDTIIDYKAAKEAGMDFVGFSSGCTPKEDFENLNVVSVSSLEELSSVLK